ncbi:MAG: cupin domain-containing protein [Planctomycetes bacterium]|nr:cupin domain-containing protein [Planctomycetota bacterium]
MSKANLFDDLPANLPDELVETLISAANVRIERIVSHGNVSPAGFWYDQAQHEFVVLLRGAARLRFEEGIIELMPGSFVNIPAHRRHRVEWTDPKQPTVWLAVHYEN